jgi:HPt (histidine-containing phosphotransfer) domain-containing protein
MTAGAMSGDEERALAVGMDDFVAKPIKVAELAAALERWIDGNQPVTPPIVADADKTPVLDDTILAGLRELEDDAGAGVLDDLVSSFLGDAKTQLEALRTALSGRNMQALGRLCHSLRGSSANLAAAGMADLCAELERMAEAGDQVGAAETLPRLEAEYSRVDVALRAAFPGIAVSEGRP